MLCPRTSTSIHMGKVADICSGVTLQRLLNHRMAGLLFIIQLYLNSMYHEKEKNAKLIHSFYILRKYLLYAY